MTVALILRAAAVHEGLGFGFVGNFARTQQARVPVFLTATLASDGVASRRSAGRFHCVLLKSRPARHIKASALSAILHRPGGLNLRFF